MGAGARARVCVKHLKDVDADMAAMCQALDTDTFSHFESVLIEINAKARQKRYGNKKNAFKPRWCKLYFKVDKMVFQSKGDS